MSPKPRMFGLAVSNLPIWNIRDELIDHLNLLSDEDFRVKFRTMGEQIEIPMLIWKGLPKNLLTYFVQRAILGVEACIPAAVEVTADAKGALTPELAFKLQEPTKLGSKTSMANSLYNLMPALVDEQFALWLTGRSSRVATHNW